jgi:hypothetical protein
MSKGMRMGMVTGMRTDMDTDMDDYRIGKVDRHFAKVNNGFYLRIDIVIKSFC